MPVLEERIRLILELMGKYDKLLDMGCNDGRYTIKFAENLKETIGIDLIKSRIKQVKSHKIKNIKFEVMNVLN